MSPKEALQAIASIKTTRLGEKPDEALARARRYALAALSKMP